MNIKCEIPSNLTEDKSAEFELMISDIVNKAALQIEREAKLNCPVDTSNLKNSIHAKPIDETSAQVGTNIEYAPYVNYGTIHMSARPFFTNAVNSVEDEFKSKIQQAVKSILD